ncbi:Inherit from NOG: expressed protein [Seminavis robusta]|uniref:Inherit from NOG: expressed protein n=1 Tax=Seminavis robusta TaxID=568900 RepID=A0A9N8E4S8_9STRA|nr:Inherit from NOG: expressed protein [Seminavis robusta]|eukprot:Sro651_g181540.1 Inherit from NOG: expressed protein (122) ;mRNA; r:19999-20456
MASENPTGNSGEEAKQGESSAAQEREFVNQGLRLWEQSRTQWLGHQNSSNHSNRADGKSDTDSTARPAAVPIEVDEIIEVVFAMPRQTATEDEPPRFPRSIPLVQMVDILVDLWEAEGLDI